MNYKYNHDCPFEAYITNLGKYNEGYLVGEWVKFPASQETLDAVMERIGIGSVDAFGCPYEEFFITDYDIYVDGLDCTMLGYNCGEYASLEKLNALAEAFENENDADKVSAVLEVESASNIDELLEVLERLDDYYFYPDINNEYDLGYYWVEESGCYPVSNMGILADYIDYEGFGRYCAQDGWFTSYGYIERA